LELVRFEDISEIQKENKTPGQKADEAAGNDFPVSGGDKLVEQARFLTLVERIKNYNRFFPLLPYTTSSGFRAKGIANIWKKISELKAGVGAVLEPPLRILALGLFSYARADEKPRPFQVKFRAKGGKIVGAIMNRPYVMHKG